MPVGGEIEGVVSSLGLLYLTLAHGEERDHGAQQRRPLSLAIVPLLEPDAVDLRARLRVDVRPRDLQEQLERPPSRPRRGPT